MTPQLPLVGEEFAGYRLRAVLGRGGMSVVYEAENPRLGSTIALKVLSPELSTDDVFRARFLKESRIAASLNHPNVIPIFDTGPFEELLYIAMRHVSGSDLRSVLRQRERISASQAVLLVGQAGRALDAAHRAGLVHRDVKPANFLIERGADEDPDHVYLADFGITKHTLSRSGLTATGQFVGTIDYIAPEQIQDKPVDGRADIYSLGCVLYECLTGRVPFVKDVDAAVIWAHVQEPPAPPSTVRPELPAAIDDVVARALAKEPDERYATCREFTTAARDALEPLLAGSAAQVTDPGIASGTPTVLAGTMPAAPTAPAPASPATAASGEPTAAPLAAAGAGERTVARPSAPPAGPGDPGAGAGAAAGPGETSASPAVGASAQLTRVSSEDQPATPIAPGDGGRPRRRGGGVSPRLAALGGIVALAVIGGVLAIALSGGGGSKKNSAAAQEGGEHRSAALAPVPTNHVTGTGTATLRLNGTMASVTLNASGLLNGAPHLLHIHAGGLGTCPPASAAKVHNGHLAISTADGIKYYGPPEAALTTSGDASVASYLAFARFPRTGSIDYKRTVPLAASLVELIRANKAVVVVHGIDYDGSGIYDNVLSHSELLPSVPGTATAPALCGSLVAVASTASASLGGGPGRPGREQVYVAQLSIESSDPWWCETAVQTPAAGPSERRGLRAGASPATATA
jgi:Protein kinase domain